jgi:class 3 adenylate cyclase
MSQRLDDPRIDQAKQALARHSWEDAYQLLAETNRERDLGPEELRLLAEASYLAGHPEITRETWERLHAESLRRGDTTGAAEAAIQILFLLIDAGLLGQFRGWSRRTEQLLEALPDSALRGMLAATRAFFLLVTGETDQALEHARRAIESATRFDDRPTLMLGKVCEGRALIFKGHLEEGLAILDEAAVAAASGELDPIVTGYLYCSLVCSWQGLAEYDRAEEWTDAMARHCDRDDVGSVRGFCRVHRAEILRLRGESREAEAEVRRALEELRAYSKGDLGWPLSELGVIRLRLGDLDGAEKAFLEAHELGWDPNPGLALVRLAQGNSEAARTSIRDALETVPDAPSWELPPNTDLRRAPLLAAQVEIAAAAGDIELAASATRELEEIAGAFPSKALVASAATSRGAVLAAEHDYAGARAKYQEGVRLWTELRAPYETARARIGLAEAYRSLGNEERVLLELRAARSTFERLGAKLDARRAAEMASSLEPAAGEPSREQKVFMFTDMVNSTNLAELIGDEAWGHLARWHNQKLASLVTEHGGEVIRTMGDGFFVTFDTARSAIECAVAIQQALDEHRRTHGFSPRVRIGLHLAEASREGSDWRGVGVHAAARIGALAEGDQILVSRETVDSAGDGFPLSGARSASLKGISEPVEIVAVEWR